MTRVSTSAQNAVPSLGARVRSALNNEKRKGTFLCAGCSAPLFNASTKFNSGTGWPSFYSALPGARRGSAWVEGCSLEGGEGCTGEGACVWACCVGRIGLGWGDWGWGG